MVRKMVNGHEDIFGEYIRKMGRVRCLTEAELRECKYVDDDVDDDVEEIPTSEAKDYTYWYLVLAEVFVIVAATYGVYWVGNWQHKEFVVEETIGTFAILTFSSIAMKVTFWLTR